MAAYEVVRHVVRFEVQQLPVQLHLLQRVLR